MTERSEAQASFAAPCSTLGALRDLADGLRRDPLFLVLLAGLALFSIATPSRIASYPALVDWPTMAALTGLLVLTKGLEVSGALRVVGRWLTGCMATERTAALSLVAAAALLSTVLTNDVALFVVVPLTMGICRSTGMAATPLIIFEALAVNAGSMLTPIGNPQNLFLWQRSGVAFGAFVLHMLPLVAVLSVALMALTAWVFPPRRIGVAVAGQHAPPDRTLLGTALVLYPLFLIATDLHHAGAAVAAVLVVFMVLRPRMLPGVDWGLLLVFILMFIDLRLLANLELIREGLQRLGLEHPERLYTASIVASQLISNVPATIALAEYTRDWRVLAYGVNIGGFGLAIGSLANLIALRMANDRRAWLSFHCYALPFLALAGGVGWLLLFRVGTAPR